MKSISLIFCTLIALAVSAPSYRQDNTETPADTSIVHYSYNNSGMGPYSFSYITADGSKRFEEAYFTVPNDPNSGLTVVGYYSYPGEEGKEIRVDYIADQNGYQVIDKSKSKFANY